MYVARSYHYSSLQRAPLSEKSSEQEMGRKRTIPRQRPAPTPLLRWEVPDRTAHATMPARTVTEPVPAPSKPVVIPPRSTSGTSTQTVRVRGQHGSRAAHSHDGAHDPKAVRPAVAALLAMTSIPPPNRNNPARRRSVLMQPKKVSIDQLVQSWREEDESRASSCANSVLDLLLEQPDELEAEVISLSEGEDEKGFLASRSASSESVLSTPELDRDDRSVLSLSGPETPSPSMRRSSSGRKNEKPRIVASPPAEDCVQDHPLMPLSEDDIPTPVIEILLPLPMKATKPKSSFKSNLTASFQALKSAARSWSNFTAPSVPADDLLTRSILTPRYPNEMRPKPSQGLPTAELRRYLNPTQMRPPSPTELNTQLQEAILHAHLNNTNVEDDGAPMIQMQTYSKTKSGSSAKNKKRIDPSSEAGRALANDSAVRQREPRENSDFLRVIVLEMNMRREGKLDPKVQGRARLWLPPRKGKMEVVGKRKVPVRWVGVSVEDVR